MKKSQSAIKSYIIVAMERDKAEQMAWLGQVHANDDERRRAEAHSLGIPFVTLTREDISIDALVLIPEPLSRARNIVAYRTHNGTLEVALLDMSDLEAVDFLRVQHRITPRLTDRSSIKHALVVYQKHLKEKFAGMLKQGKEAADSLLRHALHSGAHYIHIEPALAQATGRVVRYRIQGVLHEAMRLPEEVANYVVGSVKSLARLFPVSTTAQEGSFRIEHNGNRVGVSVVTTPTNRGERIAMRLSHHATGTVGYSLPALGFWGKGLEAVHDALNASSGAILVAGPSGSGCTTTAYTLLDHFQSDILSVATVEDQIEHTLPRVHQTTARPEIGMTTAAALRSVLRQDPDVVMVGNLDVGDASLVALQAARRGVRVLGVLKARSAAGVFDALYMHDVPALLAASTMQVAVAQRLVPRLCASCKESRSVSRAEAEVLESKINFAKVLATLKAEKIVSEHTAWKDVAFYTAGGCEACKESPGFSGYIAVVEVLPMSTTISSLVRSAGSRQDIEEAAREEGMLTLLEDALCKSVMGEVAIESVVELADRN